MENLYNKTKFILKKYNISANKSLGQNFLINDSVDNPEYILAPPPVGSTWLVPDP